jgi:CheY-specific phosphatase CheX
MTTNDITTWLDATADAMAELCSTTLAMELRKDVGSPKLPSNLTGCFVALVSQDDSLQIGLASDAAGCQILARALFASDSELNETDVNDALGEIANILAGGVKTRMASTRRGITLGLPIVMEGHLRITDRQQVSELDVAVNEVPVRLLVVCSRNASD